MIIHEENEKSKQEDGNIIFPNWNADDMLYPMGLETVTLNQLYESIYRESPPIIDTLLYPGTYLFVGAPKVGKSFMMAQFAYHISSGTPLWGLETKKGTVLYLALEDCYSRLQKRMFRMVGDVTDDHLHFAVAAKQLGSGLEDQLSAFIEEHPDTRLVIIDTLKKIRKSNDDKYSYANDYDVINQLKAFSDEHKICLLLVHHTRKETASDIFEMISGTNGLLGAADGAFVLFKENRTSNLATLEVIGRDQQEQKFQLVRDSETLCWNLDKVETELWKDPPDPLLEAIANKLTMAQPSWEGSPTSLVQWLGLDIKPNTLSLKLNVLSGRLLNTYHIEYENNRTHDGRKITLRLKTEEA